MNADGELKALGREVVDELVFKALLGIAEQIGASQDAVGNALREQARLIAEGKLPIEERTIFMTGVEEGISRLFMLIDDE